MSYKFCLGKTVILEFCLGKSYEHIDYQRFASFA